MTGHDAKADLHRYLQAAREALLWKLEGLSAAAAHRPAPGQISRLPPTGPDLERRRRFH